MLNHDILTGLIQEGQSCGAYALTATLASLELINGNPNNQNTLREMANNIYVVTGVLNPERLEVQAPEIPEIIEHTPDCLNAPSEITAVALPYINGGMVTLTMDNAIRVLAFLKHAFPGEEQRCTEIVGHPIPEAAFQRPEHGNTISIICVHKGQHWVAIDPECLYDSALGTVSPYTFADNILHTEHRDYDYSGISINVSR